MAKTNYDGVYPDNNPKPAPVKLLGETVLNSKWCNYAHNCCPKGCNEEQDAHTRSEIAKVLKANNVITGIPGQKSNLGLMLTAEFYQNLIAELEGK
jgi:hypothetical protein